jgi:sarcosine oxidase subunit alpha
MTARRHSEGGEIDRTKRLAFTFDGRTVDGYAGDTIASALLASGIRIVGRSFKYHRPRGIWGFGVEEPNAFVDVTNVPKPGPNVRATTEAAWDGALIKSVNARPTAENDRHAFIDRFARFLPAAFYYKTFMLPNWRVFEPHIREMAGLGILDKDWDSSGFADQIHHHCDVLVVGAGPAGLTAALKVAEAGKSVLLCDQGWRLGGSLLHRDGEIDGEPAARWIEKTVARLRARGATILPSTTAFGIYDHHLVALNQQQAERPDVLWHVRPDRIVLATGAIERPLPFGNNDLPGIMSADAALAYLRRHAIVPGSRVAVMTNNDTAYEPATALARAGARVTVVDCRAEPRIDAQHRQDGVDVLAGRHIASAIGRSAVEAIRLDDGRRLDVDSVLVAGGWTPTVHLYCQAKGRLTWSEGLLAFVPDGDVPGLVAAGAANGSIGLSEALASGADAASACSGISMPAPKSTGHELGLAIAATWPRPRGKERAWIDYQNDVTTKDVELAARENYVSIEHLKRYTTLGMATDQGKTSNLNGIALMAELSGRTIPEVGTTSYRPPFTPVPFTSFAGGSVGVMMNPLRRSPLEICHRADGASLLEYGGWLRPAYYGAGSPDEEIASEARQARQSVALFDGSTLGKIEVIGPQAAAFLDFIYYNTMSTLKPGRCRYGFILTEAGVVYDDGVLVRLDENRFIVSCSSSHVAGVHAMLEEWRQDRFDRGQVFIHNATTQTATLTVSGPNARMLLQSVGLGCSLEDASLPHMSTADGMFEGVPVRITRVSFTGDRSYEVSIRSDRAEILWDRLKQAGKSFQAVLIGLEALMILRAEKGYIVIGKDTDGTTRPGDLGVGSPLAKKKADFVGRRSLLTEDASRDDRREFVGLAVAPGENPLPTGAHGVVRENGRVRSIGYVTSSYFSPTLGKPIALALIERGRRRIGETILIQHLGAQRRATIAAPCAYDSEGLRLNA